MTLLVIVPFLILLAIIGAIVYGVFALRKRATEDGPDVGIGTPRRFYFYSISFIALMLLVSGVTLVAMTLLDELFGGPVVRGTTTRLATGLALTIVALPLWGLHWRYVQSKVVAQPSERRSTLRSLYCYVSMGVALGFLAFNGYRVIEWALQVGDFPAFSWAAVLVWVPVWAYHWRIASIESTEATFIPRGIGRLYLYLASALGLAMLASGVGFLVYFVLNEGYSTAFEVDLSGAERLWGEAARTALSVSLLGGLIWWAHWIKFASKGMGSVLRWIYLFVATIGGGSIASLIGVGIVIYALLAWLVGAASEAAGSHFEDLPAGIATLVVGVSLWVYHRRKMIDESADHEMPHVTRIYDLLIAAIGLLVVASTLVTLFDTFFRLISDTSAVVVDSPVEWQERIAIVLTLLLVGSPVWWAHWRRVHIPGLANPEVERPALPRKLYVMGVLCLGLLALVGGASSTLFFFLRDLLDVDLSANTLRDLSTGLSVVLTTLLVIPYHWVIYREDREFEPELPEPLSVPVTKSVLLLTAPGGAELVAQVEGALGYTVTQAHWRDADTFVPSLEEGQVERLRDEVSSASGANVLLIPDADGVRVISYS